MTKESYLYQPQTRWNWLKRDGAASRAPEVVPPGSPAQPPGRGRPRPPPSRLRRTSPRSARSASARPEGTGFSAEMAFCARPICLHGRPLCGRGVGLPSAHFIYLCPRTNACCGRIILQLFEKLLNAELTPAARRSIALTAIFIVSEPNHCTE